MCLTIDPKKKIPTKAQWAYKTLVSTRGSKLESRSQTFNWTPGQLHVARGKFEIRNGEVTGGVIHCFVSQSAAKKEMNSYRLSGEYVVRVRVPEHCIRCVGRFNTDKTPNIGARAVFLPKTKYLYYKGQWTEIEKIRRAQQKKRQVTCV